MKENLDKKGLGKGLDALFLSNVIANENDNPSDPAKESYVKTLSISILCPSKVQPRQNFSDSSLEDLALSIKEQGILQPILVRPKKNSSPFIYEIIAGERRWRAAKKVGLTEVPVIIKELDDLEARTISIIENLQRENLNSLEEALAFKELRELYNLSQEEVAQKIGKSRAYIANSIRLLKLPSEIQAQVLNNKISAGHARTLLAIEQEDVMNDLVNHIIANQLSVRELEEIVDYYKKNKTLPNSLNQNIENQNIDDTQVYTKEKRPIKPENIKNLQKLLRHELSTKVNVAGTNQHGRITISYNDEQILQKILNKLGINISE